MSEADCGSTSVDSASDGVLLPGILDGVFLSGVPSDLGSGILDGAIFLSGVPLDLGSGTLDGVVFLSGVPPDLGSAILWALFLCRLRTFSLEKDLPQV